MLDNNVNQKQPAFQTMQPNGMQQPQVAMEAVNPELLKENVQDTYVANRVANTTDDPKAMLATAGLMVPTWFAITQGMDVFNKHSRGEYETTIQHKIGKFGDRVVDSSFAKSGFAQSINNGLKSVKNFIKTKIIDKTRITRAMFYTPSMPENHMAVSNYMGMPAMQLFDYSNPIDSFKKATKYIEDLDCYGATKDEISGFKTQLQSATTDARRLEIIQDAEFKTLTKYTRDPAASARLATGFSAADKAGKIKILQNLKAFELGFENFEQMEKCMKATHKHIPEILEALHNSNKNMFARDWGSNHNLFTRFMTKVVGREVHMSEFENKLIAELGTTDLSKPENAKLKEVLERTGLINKLPKSTFGKYLNYYTHLINY